MTSTGDLVTLARGVAYGAHAGQRDKAGRPYIEHVARIAASVSTDEERILAWLHDVVEDTAVTFNDLLDMGFSGSIVAQVAALTRLSNEPRDTYYARITLFPAAVRVKLADVADNSSKARLAALPPADQVRLRKKYARAREVLEAAP